MRGPHLYTLHKTYTGYGCAICGQFYDTDDHDPRVWMVDGERVEDKESAHDPSVSDH